MNRRLISISIVLLFSCSVPCASFAAQNPPPNPLLQAIADGDIGQVRQAISSGINVNAPINELGWTALHAAVKFGKNDIASLLIENQADLNAKDGSGQTPLCMAVESGQTYAVNLLISNGANANITNNNGDNALSIAQKVGLTVIANTLIQGGATPPAPGAANTGGGYRRGTRRGGGSSQSTGVIQGRPGSTGFEPAGTNPDFATFEQPAGMDTFTGQNVLEPAAELSLDPNEVKAMVQQYPGLEKQVADVAGNSRIGMRAWERTGEDNRTTLVSAVRRQYEAELEFIKKVADEEKAQKTSQAADSLMTTRRDRLGKITREIRDQVSQQERLNRGTGTTSRRGGRGTTTTRTTSRGSRRSTTGVAEVQPNANLTNTTAQESKYDPETQSEVDTWLNASVDNIAGRIDLVNSVNELVISEISSLKPIAAGENAEKTVAAIDGILVARQERFSALQTQLDRVQQEEGTQNSYDPAGGLPADTTGQNMPTRGRRGR